MKDSLRLSWQAKACPTTATAFALALLLSGCSREPVNAAPAIAPAATVESVPDRNVVTVTNPQRFPVAPAVARHESDQILAMARWRPMSAAPMR